MCACRMDKSGLALGYSMTSMLYAIGIFRTQGPRRHKAGAGHCRHVPAGLQRQQQERTTEGLARCSIQSTRVGVCADGWSRDTNPGVMSASDLLSFPSKEGLSRAPSKSCFLFLSLPVSYTFCFNRELGAWHRMGVQSSVCKSVLVRKTPGPCIADAALTCGLGMQVAGPTLADLLR